MSRHKLKPTSAEGYAWILTPVRAELGHIPVQKLTRRDVDELVRKLRKGGTKSVTVRTLRDGRTEETTIPSAVGRPFVQPDAGDPFACAWSARRRRHAGA